MKKMFNIQALRGIAILLVCAYHLFLIQSKYLTKIGDYSYSMYLFHILVFNTILKASHIFINKSSYLISVFIISLMSISMIFWGRINYIYIERPLIKYTKSLPKSIKIFKKDNG